MVDNLRTVGAESLSVLAVKLKAAGNGGLRRELLRGIRVAAAPLPAAARHSALETLPKAGGLNQVVASSKFAVRTRTAGRNVGVRVVGVNPHHLRSLDQGRVRHPTFGRDPWVTQKITPGWWTKPMEEGSPHVREAILGVLRDVGRRL